VDAEEEVAPERTLLHHRRQIPGRGAYQAKVGLLRSAVADAIVRPVLEDTQDGGLQRLGHLGDLVEEQRPSARRSDLAFGPGAARAGEGAGGVPEKLALEQGRGDGAAVEGVERTGGFSMLMGDFLSLAQLQLPVKVVVYDNSSLAFVAIEMKANGFLDTGVDLKNPDFAALARAVGIKGIRVERSADVEGAPREAFAHPGPALVDVTTAKQELVMPPKIEIAQAKGFSLFMLKAIINSRGDEIVELAETNLGR
jgi:hypothetical protein